MESSETISALIFSASSRATCVLPEAVGPVKNQQSNAGGAGSIGSGTSGTDIRRLRHWGAKSTILSYASGSVVSYLIDPQNRRAGNPGYYPNMPPEPTATIFARLMAVIDDRRTNPPEK